MTSKWSQQGWGGSHQPDVFFGVVWGTMVDNHYIYMKKLESVTLMMTRGDSPIFTEIPLTAEASLFLFTGTLVVPQDVQVMRNPTFRGVQRLQV